VTNEPRVRVRHAEPGEATKILELWRLAETAPSATDDAAALELLLRRQPDGLLVAEADDGTIVGSVVAVFDGWRGNLYRLAVAPDHRRRGVARALVTGAERQLRDAGCRRASALVLHDHADALACWAALGYAPDPRVTRSVKTL
jgi:ribosomal protein S18 acetylase RimI-like enzyme